MNITIYKSEIEEALKRESSLVSKGAFSDKGESLHDTLYIDEYEFKVLESAYKDALSVVISVLREFLAVEPQQSDSAIIFSLRKDYPEMEQAIKGDIVAYMTKNIMSYWLSVVYPAQAKLFEQSALSALNNLNTKLYYKAPPLR